MLATHWKKTRKYVGFIFFAGVILEVTNLFYLKGFFELFEYFALKITLPSPSRLTSPRHCPLLHINFYYLLLIERRREKHMMICMLFNFYIFHLFNYQCFPLKSSKYYHPIIIFQSIFLLTILRVYFSNSIIFFYFKKAPCIIFIAIFIC